MAEMQDRTGGIPDCPGPDPKPRGPARFAMPAGAVDTHAHVIGSPADWPLASNRSYTAPEATAAMYTGMLDATGSTYGVLVQVSVHGTDNRLMLQTMQAHPQRLKGVAVVDPGRPEREYRDLRDQGIMGLRINILFAGGPGLQALEEYDAICQSMGWHLQLLLDARELVTLGPRLSRLRSQLVIDHMGHLPANEGVTHPGFQYLLGLVRDGRAWVKLSGAYRLSQSGFPYHDTIPLARALVEAAPDRCVWGSDWPHVATWGHMPNVGDLLDLLADWVPDAATRDRVLSDNARKLYGFP